MSRSAWLSVVFCAVVASSVCASAAEGIIDLGPEEIAKARGADITVPGYSVPSFEDWNNDHLRDLIVGEGGGGFTGKIRVYLNVGTEADPCFADFFYVQADGQDLSVPPQGCQGSFPRVVQWDGDGRQDLLVGLADGTAKIFLNIADNNAPAFDAGTLVKVGSEGAYTLDIGARATPILAHWNDDGMLDIIAGGLDGAIHVYYNCGCGGSVPPHFFFSPIDGTFIKDQGHDLLVQSGRSSPAVVDADGDGKQDLLTGCTDGLIFFYKNVGTDSLPMFAGYTLVQSNGVPIDLPGAVRSRPEVCRWTGDGYWDLLVGYGDGKIRLYRGLPKLGDLDADGALDGDDLTILAQALDKPIGPEGSAADLNLDGAVDNLDLRLFADLWLAEHSPAQK